MHRYSLPLILPITAALSFTAACEKVEKDAPIIPAPVVAVAPAPVADAFAAADLEDAGDTLAVAPVMEESPPTPRTLFEEEALFVEGDVAEEHREIAKQLMAEDKPGEAIESFRKALFAQPTHQSWAELGRAYLEAGEDDRGLACLEEALTTNRFMFDDRVEMAKRYLAKGDLEKARHHAEIVAVNSRDNVDANYTAGMAYMKSNMWKEAVGSFERVVEVEPDNKFARNNLGYAALQVGEDHIALRHLEETLDLEPTSYMMNNLGIAYERLAQEIDAYASFLRAVEMKPGYVNAIVNRDRIALSLTDEEKQLAMDIVEELKTPRVPTAVASVDDETPLGE
jgi:tetratricopeptide (TPR) repeat protein